MVGKYQPCSGKIVQVIGQSVTNRLYKEGGQVVELLDIDTMLRETKDCLNCGKRLKRGHGYKIRRGYCSRDCFNKKSTKQAWLEKVYGKPIRELILETLNECGSVEVAAGLFAVNKQALYRWMKQHKIEKVVRFE